MKSEVSVSVRLESGAKSPAVISTEVQAANG